MEALFIENRARVNNEDEKRLLHSQWLEAIDNLVSSPHPQLYYLLPYISFI
jgi:hypothetical protein